MNLSVLIPTLNCVKLLERHIETFNTWSDLADEVIVVDSHSNDGTLELLREKLIHRCLRIVSHPKGLYQSWNHGIQQSVGQWIYVSTAGDKMDRDQLLHLLSHAEENEADVICSPPIFETSEGNSLPAHDWPINRIIAEAGITEPRVLDSLYMFAQGLIQVPFSILGSSASNLYRGNHLRARPFPLDCGVCGDTAWPLKYAFETRFCYTPRKGSTFLFHEKDQPFDLDRMDELCRNIRSVALETIQQHSDVIGMKLAALFTAFIEQQNKISHDPVARARANFRQAKDASPLPWFLNPKALKLRKEKKEMISRHRDGGLKPPLLREIEDLLPSLETRSSHG